MRNSMPENLKEMKREIQKTHFSLGTNETDYVTNTGHTLVEHPITKEDVLINGKNRLKAIEQMRNANFKLPNENILKTGASSYKNNISDMTESDKL